MVFHAHTHTHTHSDDLREHLKNAQKLIMAQHQEVSSSDTESDSSKSGNETLIDISVSEFVLVTLGVVLRWFHSTSRYSVPDSHIFRSWGQWSGNETKHTVYTLRVQRWL